MHSSAKLAWAIAQAHSSAANTATQALPIIAGRRPMRCMSRAAGIEADATPSTASETGSVASSGSGAISVPTIPPNENSVKVPQAAKPWAMVRIQTLRMRWRCRRAARRNESNRGSLSL